MNMARATLCTLYVNVSEGGDTRLYFDGWGRTPTTWYMATHDWVQLTFMRHRVDLCSHWLNVFKDDALRTLFKAA